MNVCGISSYQTNFSGLVPKGTSNVRKLCPNAVEAIKTARNEVKNIEKIIIDLENEISMGDSVCTGGYIRCLQNKLKTAKTLKENLLDLIKNADDSLSVKFVERYKRAYLTHIGDIDNRFDQDVSKIGDMGKLRIPAEHLEQYKVFYGIK